MLLVLPLMFLPSPACGQIGKPSIFRREEPEIPADKEYSKRSKQEEENLKRPQRIKVAATLQAYKIVQRIEPAYPQLARSVQIQGTVRYNALIGPTGLVEALGLVSGHPMLVSSAQAAIRQWRYKPTILSGEPAEVLTQIEVKFTLPKTGTK